MVAPKAVYTRWCCAGMLENVLGRVLDAFTSAVNRLIPRDSIACRLPADDQPTVALMAREPSALALGEPVAFAAGRR